MEYSVKLAKEYIGKRFVVGLRWVNRHGEDTYSGLWGIVDSVHENGVLIKVEGGITQKFWMMPPDLDGIEPASEKYYQLDGHDEVVENVDYEAHWTVADDPKLL